MALTETYLYRVEVNENYFVGVRRTDIIKKDNLETARSYHRAVFAPGADVSGQPQVVQDVAAAVWSAEVIAAYEAAKEAAA